MENTEQSLENNEELIAEETLELSTENTIENLDQENSAEELNLEVSADTSSEEETDIALETESKETLEAVDSESLSDEEALPENLITDEVEILRALEAMIFASPKAISLKRIKSILSSSLYDIRNINELIQRLMNEYENRGFQLIKVAGSYQFRTHASQGELLQNLLEDKPVRLSSSALEVLAIISYKQPVSRSEIDVVRGVDSGHLTRGLLDKNLIRTVGHAETPGRPLLYGTTPQFLEIFSLNSLDDLPSLEEFDRDLANSANNTSEDGENDTTVLDADPAQMDAASLEEAALFYDKASPLAAEPDRGQFDEPSDDDVETPDFGVADRAREEVI